MSGFTPEQLEARRETLGASELPVVLGISPYKTRFELWLEKRGLSEGRAEDTPWQKMGLRMEPVIAEMYQEDMLALHGQILTLDGDGRTSVRRTNTPWSCTPDREVKWIAGNEEWGVDFKKSRFGEGYGLPGTEEVPGHIYAQAQWSMFVTDLGRWDIAALIGGDDLRIYHVMRNDEFLEAALAEAEDFWTHVTSGEEPPIDGSKGAKQYLQARFPEDREVNPLPVYDDEGVLDTVRRLGVARETIANLEKEQATLENQLKLLIADRPGIVTPLARITWKKAKDTHVIAWEDLARDALGDKVGQYITKHSSVKVGSRRFLFTPTHKPAKEAV